jgi:hypothetical protein
MKKKRDVIIDADDDDNYEVRTNVSQKPCDSNSTEEFFLRTQFTAST